MNQGNIFETYLHKAFTTSSAPQFFILEGLQNFSKEHPVYKMFTEILGIYISSDLLFVKDYSPQLKKEHIIKIQTDTTHPVTKILASDYQYTDVGVREINQWVQKSSISGKKIVFIEHLERINTAAVNAFLKTAEEPHPGTVIVATTKNKSVLLDTILSRALTFPVSDQADPLIFFSDIHERYPELSEMLGNPDQLFSSSHGLAKKHDILSTIADAGEIIPFVDGLIALFVKEKKRNLAEIWLKNKQILLGNVNIKQSLFYSLLQLG